MARKRWTAITEETPSILKVREKRKWQIALRRYVLDKNPCISYAPYFGLDIENMRRWVALQFESGEGWDDFGKKWQFDHIIPVAYFDFSSDPDLKLCWNFSNIRINSLQNRMDKGVHQDLLTGKEFFEELYANTRYKICEKMLEKIAGIEKSGRLNSENQQRFITENKPYLEILENYSSFEFELINRGRSVEEVKKEVQFLKKFNPGL